MHAHAHESLGRRPDTRMDTRHRGPPLLSAHVQLNNTQLVLVWVSRMGPVYDDPSGSYDCKDHAVAISKGAQIFPPLPPWGAIRWGKARQHHKGNPKGNGNSYMLFWAGSEVNTQMTTTSHNLTRSTH